MKKLILAFILVMGCASTAWSKPFTNVCEFQKTVGHLEAGDIKENIAENGGISIQAIFDPETGKSFITDKNGTFAAQAVAGKTSITYYWDRSSEHIDFFESLSISVEGQHFGKAIYSIHSMNGTVFSGLQEYGICRFK